MSLRVASRIADVELSLIRQVQLAAAPGAINLGLGEPTLPMPEPVRRAVADFLASGQARYTLTAGDLDLRRRLGLRYPDNGGGPDSIIVTCGSQEALALVVLGLLDPGDSMLVPEIAYPAYLTLASIAGGEPILYPTPRERGFRPAAEEIASRLTARTRLVLLGSPGNPTGAVMPESEVRALERLAQERDLWIVSDEIYADIYLGPSPPVEPRGPRTLVVSGFSKSHALTGLRTGWLAGPPDLLARLLPLHQQLVLVAPTLAQVAAHAALDLDASFAEEVRGAYRSRWTALRDAIGRIPGLSVSEPDGAFYALVDARERIGLASRDFAIDTARSGGVVIVPGDAFGQAGRGFLRISYAGTEEEIRIGMERLASALDRWNGR